MPLQAPGHLPHPRWFWDTFPAPPECAQNSQTTQPPPLPSPTPTGLLPQKHLFVNGPGGSSQTTDILINTIVFAIVSREANRYSLVPRNIYILVHRPEGRRRGPRNQCRIHTRTAVRTPEGQAGPAYPNTDSRQLRTPATAEACKSLGCGRHQVQHLRKPFCCPHRGGNPPDSLSLLHRLGSGARVNFPRIKQDTEFKDSTMPRVSAARISGTHVI